MIPRQYFAVTLDPNATCFGYHGYKHKLNIIELNTWNYDVQKKHLIATSYMICTKVIKSDKNVRLQYILNRIRTAPKLYSNHTDQFEKYEIITKV